MSRIDDLIAPLEAEVAAALREEIEDTRRKLDELTKLAGTILVPRDTRDMVRLWVGVTRDEFNKIQNLARRCNTSVSALGKVAMTNLVIQAETGVIPMVPTALTSRGAEPTIAEREERVAQYQEESDTCRARINTLKAQIELDRLAELANGSPCGELDD